LGRVEEGSDVWPTPERRVLAEHSRYDLVHRGESQAAHWIGRYWKHPQILEMAESIGAKGEFPLFGRRSLELYCRDLADAGRTTVTGSLDSWDASLASVKELRVLLPLAEHVLFRARHTIYIVNSWCRDLMEVSLTLDLDGWRDQLVYPILVGL